MASFRSSQLHSRGALTPFLSSLDLPRDQYWAYVTSQHNFLGPNGASGTGAFPDDRSSIVWTPTGSVSIDTSLGVNAAKFTGAYGNRLSAPGITLGLQLSNSAPWTQEFWVVTNGTATYQLLGNLDNDTGSGHYWIILNSTFGGLHTVQFGVQAQTCRFGTTTLPTGALQHIELAYDGTNLRCFINGTQVGAAVALPALTASTREFLIGSGWGSSAGYTPYPLNGWMIARRTTKGVCRHTAGGFTPPTPPLPTA